MFSKKLGFLQKGCDGDLNLLQYFHSPISLPHVTRLSAFPKLFALPKLHVPITMHQSLLNTPVYQSASVSHRQHSYCGYGFVKSSL